MSTKISTTVNEGSSCRLSFTLTDFDDVAVTVITTATMTLKDRDTGNTINERTDVDVSGDFDGSGNFSRVLTAADNVIVNTDAKEEVHIATFEITSGDYSYKESVVFNVVNLKFVN